MASDWFTTNAPTGTSTASTTGTVQGQLPSGYLTTTVNPWTGVAPTTPAYVGPAPYQATPFTAPTVTDDPSFKFRLEQGLEAINRGAAAKGTLLTGGTQKALERYGSDLASTEYAAAFNRALAANQLNNQYGRTAQQDLYNQGLLTNTQQYGRGMDAYTSAYNTFLNNQGAQRANQQDVYNRLFGLSQMGQAGAAGQADLATQIGNAQAAGTIGSANAIGSGINSATSTAAQLAALYGLMPRSSPYANVTVPDIGGG